MKNENLFIFAKITPKKEFYKDAKNAILSIVHKTLDEDGCYEFKLLFDEDNLYLYEEWKSLDVLEKHYEMPYIKEVFKSYESWLDKPMEIIKMKST